MQADQLNPTEKICLKLGKKKNHYSIFLYLCSLKQKEKHKNLSLMHMQPLVISRGCMCIGPYAFNGFFVFFQTFLCAVFQS